MAISTAAIGIILLFGGTGEQTKEHRMNQTPGYTQGTSQVPRAPITLAELELLKKTLLITDEDVKYLRMSKEILVPQTEKILDVWYGLVGSNEHLLYFFGNAKTGKPEPEYLASVRKRFGIWISDTADAKFDQAWLDYQFEIGRRHHRTGKNKTDKSTAVDNINYRYIPALTIPVTTTLLPFLRNSGRTSEEDVQKMHTAWLSPLAFRRFYGVIPTSQKMTFRVGSLYSLNQATHD